MKRRRPDASHPGLSGVLVLDKPEGPTSHDLVVRARRLLRTSQIGHTGTLDPMATGVLVLCIGRATRLVRFLTSSDKAYHGRLQLGWETDSQDRTGEPLGPTEPVPADAAVIRAAMEKLTGRRMQSPPSFSAKRIAGVRAHRLARAGRPAQPDPVEVEIRGLRPRALEGSTVEFEVECSAGTYVRSLAAEIGREVGCGAHLLSLRRTRSGEFDLAQALPLADVERTASGGRRRDLLIEPGRLEMGMPAVIARAGAISALAHGRPLGPEDWRGELADDVAQIRVLSPDGALLAVAQREPGLAPGTLRPRVVLVRPDECPPAPPAPPDPIG